MRLLLLAGYLAATVLLSVHSIAIADETRITFENQGTEVLRLRPDLLKFVRQAYDVAPDGSATTDSNGMVLHFKARPKVGHPEYSVDLLIYSKPLVRIEFRKPPMEWPPKDAEGEARYMQAKAAYIAAKDRLLALDAASDAFAHQADRQTPEHQKLLRLLHEMIQEQRTKVQEASRAAAEARLYQPIGT